MQKPCLLSCFFFLFFVSLSFITQNCFSCPQDQRQSLLEFKNLLTHNIKNKSRLIDLELFTTWRPNSDCCKWRFVRCNALSPSKEVIDLYLNSLVLDGSMSSSLLRPVLRISSLMRLDVSYNFIKGEIPGDGFVNLTRLISLNMSGNSLGDVLSLRNNSLKCSITKEISNLTSLRVLDLSENNLHGTLPSNLGNLTCMVESPTSSSSILDFSFYFRFSFLAKIEQPDLEVNWKRVNQVLSNRNSYLYTVLDLSKNNPLGEIPSSLGNLKSLKLSKPLLQRHLWIHPTKFWMSREARDLRPFTQQPLWKNPANVV